MYLMNDNMEVDQNLSKNNRRSSLTRGVDVRISENKAIKAHKKIQWNCIRVICFNLKFYCSPKCLKWFRCLKISKYDRMISR